MRRSVITGTGSYIPGVIKSNSDFSANEFYTEDQVRIDSPASVITQKFKQITGIEERRYAPAGMCTSDMAAAAATLAIQDSGINPESIDQIIVAHNFGDIPSQTNQTDILPALACRVKHQLNISNPACIPYDLIFGCPGWLQGLIQADAFLQSGLAKTCLVIGAETLSRVIDDYDRDSMIFADGAGACILQYVEIPGSDTGILSKGGRSDCGEETNFIHFDKSNNPQVDQDTRYMKMKGRKVYEYALRYVPAAMKDCFDKSGYDIKELKKIFIHQANEKMDEAIVKAFYNLYNITAFPPQIMPMCIQWLGNSSVATIPTLFDLVRKGQMPEHNLQKGDIVMFASVGAGMHINAVCYRY
jgi:3-oxoacyl-[acyl-carrier-protein] synthase-3